MTVLVISAHAHQADCKGHKVHEEGEQAETQTMSHVRNTLHVAIGGNPEQQK